MSEFIDPLRDPRFPDRPQTPDFWRLSEILHRVDATATEPTRPGHPLEVVIGDIADFDSAIHLSNHRVRRLCDQTFGPDTAAIIIASVQAAWLDGFAVGAMFEREGGHRDAQ